jgi:hypothetical protein
MSSKYGNRIVNKKEILNLISQTDIFRFYIPNFEGLNKLFSSNLREDKNPSCIIRERNGIFYYKDYTQKEYYDCFGYVALLFGANFYQALEIIRQDFRLPLVAGITVKHDLSSRVPVITKKDNVSSGRKLTEIDVKIRKWNIYDKRYWSGKYDITIKDLNKFNVFPLSYFWINSYLIPADLNGYGYYFGKYPDGRNAWKIYQPFSKRLKWLSNVNKLQGFDQLPWIGEKLVITKSLKDVIVLSKLGYPAIAPHGESHFLDKNIMQKLLNRFKSITIIYDKDSSGEAGSKTLMKAYNLNRVFLKGAKDASDFIEKYDYRQLKEYLEVNGV